MGKTSKVVVCGLTAAGKTAVLEQMIYGNHIIGTVCQFLCSN
jgi:NF-kappa-B inhibitor-interacting Ras-like protein